MFVGVWLFTTITALCLHPDPSGHGTHTQLGLPPCPSVLLFNRPCPGCGLTTSFTAFLHGDFAFAFKAHPLGPFMYLGMTAWAGLCLYGWIKGLRLDGGGKTFNRAMSAFLAVFFTFGIARMILDPGYSGAPEQRYVSKLVATTGHQQKTH
jgi:hypothetical protein